MQLFYNLEEQTENGLPLKTKTFGAVIADYIKFREKDHKQGRTQAGMLRQVKRVLKFWREYAGKKAIESIGRQGAAGLRAWRKDYDPKLIEGPASDLTIETRPIFRLNPSLRAIRAPLLSILSKIYYYYRLACIARRKRPYNADRQSNYMDISPTPSAAAIYL